MTIILLSVAILFLAAILGLLLWRGLKTGDSSQVMMLQNQIAELNRTLDTKLGESQKAIREQFGESARIIREITQELTKVGEGQKQVMNVTEQLQNLQDILKNPKQRGVLGEYYLETVLKNVLPPGRFQMQYKFENGDIVDAVIFLDKDKILPIDSKFSLENYNKILETREPAERERLETAFRQDLKLRIDETAKYIRPKEGTMDFAFMFIPSEGIYYDLLINQVGAVKASTRDLIEYAFQQKKVIIVSPTSFMAYLQTVLQGLKALAIEESAKEIRKRVEQLSRHLTNYDSFMQRLGATLGTTVSHYNRAYKEFGKIDKDIYRISGSSGEVEPLQLQAPSTDEEEG